MVFHSKNNRQKEKGGLAEMTQTDPVIISEVTKRFGAVTALDAVSLRVATGETFGLIGPNGSGKTTLIRLLLGLGKPNKGHIEILGSSKRTPKITSQIGYMTQSSALYSELSIEENLQFFASIYGLHGAKQRSSITQTLELVGLADRRKSPIHTLSGGMKQRVSLACALVHNPTLIFLDEPTVGIDPELRMMFWDYFKQLNASGVTIIVSTHNLDEAARCNRLGLMRFGKLLADDTPEAIKKKSGKDDFDSAFLYFAQRNDTKEQ